MGYFLLGSNAVNIFWTELGEAKHLLKHILTNVTEGSVQHWGAAAPSLHPTTPLVSSICLLEVLNEYLHHYYGYLDP
jgi:hypothetical protein